MNSIYAIGQALPFIAVVALVVLTALRAPLPVSAVRNSTRGSSTVRRSVDPRILMGPIS
jgi:hypothetical protein